MHKKDSRQLSGLQLNRMIDHALTFDQKKKIFNLSWESDVLKPVALGIGMCCVLGISFFWSFSNSSQILTEGMSLDQSYVSIMADDYDLMIDEMLLSYYQIS